MEKEKDSAYSKSFQCPHGHDFISEHQLANERRTWWVIILTVSTMGLEIVSGLLFGSMALLADGWHMASHASAMSITAAAYYLARKHKYNPRFTFGTGKIGDLAGYSSALLLLLIAAFMSYESLLRFLNPVQIQFREAIGVAFVGLAVNLASAFILKEQDHHHGHDDHEHHRDHDHNLRAAYFHVLADALTSILAIAALSMGMIFGWSFLDPLMGIVGALLISRWSIGLMRQSGSVLLDRTDNMKLVRQIRQTLETLDGVKIVDLHVWRLGTGHYGAIVSMKTSGGGNPDFFKEKLCRVPGLSHLTIEVN